MKTKPTISVIVLALLATITLLVGIYLMTSSMVKAQKEKPTESAYLAVNPNPAANAKNTNALKVALTQARALGMKSEPLAIRITKGAYKDFQAVGESDSLYDSKIVYAVWLSTEPFQIIAPGARQRTVTQLVFFIDVRNGHPFGFTYGNNIESQLTKHAWQSLTLANAEQYSVPVFDPDNLIPVNHNAEIKAEATETPAR